MSKHKPINFKFVSFMRKTFFIILLLILSANLFAQTGTLPADYDRTFGESGYVLNNNAEITDAVINRKGQIVVTHGNALSIYDRFGNLIVSRPTVIFAGKIAIQANDNIITIGRIFTGGENFDSAVGVARYSPNLNLDTSFGNGGTITHKIGGYAQNIPLDLAVQGDNRIIVGGIVNTGVPGNTGFIENHHFLTRLTTNGQLDTSFRNGFLIEPEGGTHLFGSLALLETRTVTTIAVGGKLQYCVTSDCPTYTTLKVYDGNGFRRTAFAGGNTAIYPGTGLPLAGSKVAIQPDGKFVISDIVNSPTERFGVARILSNGGFDPTFGGGGIVNSPFNSNTRIAAVKIDGNGRVLVAGTAFDGSGEKSILARYNPNGTFDTNFAYTSRGTINTDGYRNLFFPAESNHLPFGLFFQGSRILVFGRLGTISPPTNRSFLVRLNG